MENDYIFLCVKVTSSLIAGAYGVYATVTDFHEKRDGRQVLSRSGRIGLVVLLVSTFAGVTVDAWKELNDNKASATVSEKLGGIANNLDETGTTLKKTSTKLDLTNEKLNSVQGRLDESSVQISRNITFLGKQLGNNGIPSRADLKPDKVGKVTYNAALPMSEGPIKIRLSIKNDGTELAKKVKAYFAADIVATTDETPNNDFADGVALSLQPLMGGYKTSATADSVAIDAVFPVAIQTRSFSKEEIESLRSGRSAIYIVGTSFYTDSTGRPYGAGYCVYATRNLASFKDCKVSVDVLSAYATEQMKHR